MSAHPPNDGTEPYRSALPIMQINPWRALSSVNWGGPDTI